MSLQENETLRNMLKDKEDNAEVIAQMDQFESKTWVKALFTRNVSYKTARFYVSTVSIVFIKNGQNGL